MATMSDINAVGRRKTSVARVYMFAGKGSGVLVNKVPIEEYFGGRTDLLKEAMSPFDLLGKENDTLIKINVKGGGQRGQAGAIKLGISRVLAQLDEQTRKLLRTNGFLTRDARMVERKKVGKHKARKSIQYSKR
jgi:small subunit ribosomal protein S9